MKLLLALLLLVAPCLSHAQESLSLSKMPSKEALQSAKDVIRAASATPTKLRQLGYAMIDIKIEGELTSYVPPGSDDCIKTLFIPKNTAYEGLLLNKDEAQIRWTRIEPVAWDRVLVVGTSNGNATLIWMTVVNNKAVVIAAFQFQIGEYKPPPKPDDPPVPVPDDPLVKAFRVAAQQDAALGKADKKWLGDLAGIYDGASRYIPDTVLTIGQLDEMLYNARKAAGIPEPEVQFPNLRKAIKQEIYTRLGVNDGSANVALTADTKRQAQVVFGKISTALTEVAK